MNFTDISPPENSEFRIISEEPRTRVWTNTISFAKNNQKAGMKYHIKKVHRKQRAFADSSASHGHFLKELYPEWIKRTVRNTDEMFGYKDPDLHTEPGDMPVFTCKNRISKISGQ